MKYALAILVFALALPTIARSAPFEPDTERARVDLPPDRNGQPVPVRVSLFLLDVTDVDGAKERFTGAIYVNLTWQDSRMAFDAARFGADRVLYLNDSANDQLQTMWSPVITVANQVGSPSAEDSSLTIYSDGRVEYESRISGEFSSPMDLRDFPFDRQVLQASLESFEWDNAEVQLLAADETGHFRENLATRDWNLASDRTALKASVHDERYATGDVYSRYTAKIIVDRQPWYYMWSVIFPLILVSFFGMTCFYWGEDSLSERIAQTLACLLTVTAQSLAVNGDLPKISYFTRIDYAFLLTYLILMVVTVESIIVKSINEANHARADRIDSICTWAVPLVYILGMIFVFRP